MEIKFTIEQREEYRERVNSLLFELKPPLHINAPQDGFAIEPYISCVIRPEDIKDIHLKSVNGYGNKQASYFLYNNGYIGLEAQAYQELRKISEGIQGLKTLKDYVSIEFICDAIFDWMEKKYKNLIQIDVIEFLENLISINVVEREIWLPIANVTIQGEFYIGKILFRSITRGVIDEWESESRKNARDEVSKIEAYFISLRKQVQSATAAVLNVTAEKEKAVEIAVCEAEKAVSVLRIFASPPIIPEAISYLDLVGSVHKEFLRYLCLMNSRLIFDDSREKDDTLKQLTISARQVDQFNNAGMNILSEILHRGTKTQFEKQVLNSLYIYSKSERMVNLSDRLLYIFTAVESILKRDYQEPIQQNIGDRIALFIGKSVDHRKAIVKNVKEVYAMRSAFVHYGKNPKSAQREIIFEFLQNTFFFFHALIMNIGKFENRNAFLDALENCKYSGGLS